MATISGTTVNWSPVRVDGYGPVLGYQSPTLTANTLLADTLVWRSRGIDPSCFYNLGARYYDPLVGHFLSPDPLGHAGSMDLHSFCNGDPVNCFDPTGRFGKGAVAGVGDLMDFSGGPSYESMTGDGSKLFGAGYEVSQVVFGGLTQVAVIGLTDGLGELAEGGLLSEESFGA
ncbi:MAG: RHS repeat-associated core domain-containing protein, partial [Verrucomicrobiota bacterium]